MLKRLFVQDFVLIDNCVLEFENGFSAFTGETGAGKSLLIDAMCLLGGERASSSFVKQHANKAIVEGVFDLTNNKVALKKLKDSNLPYTDNLVYLRREIQRDGKSYVYVNNKAATLQLLKDIIQHEIDIHSQHDNQYLLNKSNHIQLIDHMLMNKELIEEVRESFLRYSTLKSEFEAALSTTYNENDLQFIQAEIDEINNADLSIHKEDALESRQKEIVLYEKSFKKISQVVHLLKADDGINVKLYEGISTLEELEDERIAALYHRLKEHYNEIVDVEEQLSDYLDKLELSDEEINNVQQELYEIQRLKRKYGPTIDAILAKRDSLIAQTQLIEHRQEYIDRTSKALEEARVQFFHLAQDLSQERRTIALQLQQEIEKHCHDLMLPHTQFVVDFETNDEGNVHGIDDVEFYISVNPGEMLKPLSRVASGGELSRLMLGLKTIFTRLQGIQTVIFDEIDSGVSGAVATAIGIKMATLAKDVQVFSVTHLAQVAACAQKHYLVKKDSNEYSTKTEVINLDNTKRIEQLALISSGSVSEASLTAASEMYSYCKTQVADIK